MNAYEKFAIRIVVHSAADAGAATRKNDHLEKPLPGSIPDKDDQGKKRQADHHTGKNKMAYHGRQLYFFSSDKFGQ
jgi:hypothetical protein